MSNAPSPSSAWSSSTTTTQIAAWLSGRQHVAVLTHVKPDGDAVGSAVGLVRALRHKGIEARAFFYGPKPGWSDRLLGAAPAEAEFCAPGTMPAMPSGGEPDAIVVCDTGSWSQLEPVKEWLKARRERAAVVDHHAHGDAEVAERRVIDPGQAAACMILAKLAAELLGLASIAALPRDVAAMFYLGTATDTGWFKHSNVEPGVLRIAADLLQAGADHTALYQLIEQQEKPERIRLAARALSSLELFSENRIAVMTLRAADFAASGAGAGDAGSFADYVNVIETVRVAAVLTEADASEFGMGSGRSGGPAALTKISLRSKPPMPGRPDVDVNKVAQGFGGGGHVRAAGAKMAAPIDDVKKKLVEAIEAAFGQ